MFYREQSLGTFPTRDVACEGLFLSTGPLDLRTHDIVKLRTYLHGRRYTLSGMVVHGDDRGVGILLGGEHGDAVRCIPELLRHRSVLRNTARSAVRLQGFEKLLLMMR